MTQTQTQTPCLTLALALLATLATSTGAGAGESMLFSEAFEDVGPTLGGPGPVNLVAEGWQFSIQVTQAGGEGWHEGPPGDGSFVDWPAYDGAHYLAVDSDIVDGVGDSGSAWAVLPDVAGQKAGSTLTLRLRGFPNASDVFQVRYAPTGGTDTGSGAFDVGDFTALLFEEDLWVACEFPSGCAMNDEWYLVDVELPGSGRVALRYHIPSEAGGSGSHVAIDALTIGDGINEPPYPAEGELVHWTLAGSPYVIPDNRIIPEGATVVVDAGVSVSIDTDKELLVLGEFRAEGMAGQPVVFTAPDQSARIAATEGGVVTLDHAEIACNINVAPGNIFGSPAGELIARDTLFREPAVISGSLLGHARALLVLERCTLEGVKVGNTHCQARIVDTTFVDAGQSGVLLLGYLHLDGVSLDNSQLHIGAPHGPQPMYLNNIVAVNYAEGGGLLLRNAQNFLLGPDNVIQGNLYPIEFGPNVAGILPGSVVPSSGNANDFITDAGKDFDPIGNVVWAPLEVPYVVEEWRFMNATRVLPGATVLFKPAAGFGIEFPSELVALGTPDQPVTFAGFGGATWDGLAYLFHGSGSRLDHCIVRDADSGVTLVESILKVDNCLFENNIVGVSSGGFVPFVRGTRFVGNGIGLSSPFDADGTTNPNLFLGNGIGVAGDIDDTAIGNWWGDGTGPAAPGNPGSGDAISGPVPYAPFLIDEPDETPPPTLRLLEAPSPSYVPGTKTILNWTVDDGAAVASQRVLFSDFGHYPDQFTIVAENLGPEVRSFEFVVPDVGLNVANANQAIRIEAIDASGRVGWDEQTMFISVAGLGGEVEFTMDLEQPFEPGDSLLVTWDSMAIDPLLGTAQALLLLDVDSEFVPLSGTSIGSGGLPSLVDMPDVSTDSARIALTATGGLNRRKTFYSPTFSIRPDERIGDPAPTIELLSPSGGTFPSGGTVPIAWTASDDEGIHSFLIMASYDGGDVWHHLTKDLPPTQTSYDWRLPKSTGLPGVQLRVVVRDRRFQNSSDTATITIAADPDIDGDGVVGGADLGAILAAWGECTPPPAECPADLDQNGVVDAGDLGLVLGGWS